MTCTQGWQFIEAVNSPGGQRCPRDFSTCCGILTAGKLVADTQYHLIIGFVRAVMLPVIVTELTWM